MALPVTGSVVSGLSYDVLGVVFAGIAYGRVADDVEDFIGGNDTMADLVARYGTVGLTGSYLDQSLPVVALIGAGFAVQSALRPCGEKRRCGPNRCWPHLSPASGWWPAT